MPNYRGRMPVLSDHAYQSRIFRTKRGDDGSTEMEIGVGTWNIQDKCFSKENHHQNLYGNNPYDLDETVDNFIARKRAQIAKIGDMLSINDHIKDDIIFLQEIDFLLPPKGGRYASHELKDAHNTLQHEFYQILRSRGYECILTQRPQLPYKQQPMATLYNANRLSYQGSQGVLPNERDERGAMQYRGYESSLIVNATGQPITATNLHLGYGRDYRAAIEALQQDAERRGVLSIMGGDTNNIQNQHLSTSLGDWHLATNFSRDKTTGVLTIQHDEQSRNQKSYDRFFGVPSQDCSLETYPSERSEFVTINARGEAQFKPIESQQIRLSRSRVGERWRRGKDIVSELQTRYHEASRIQDKLNLLSEISQVIDIKGLHETTCLSPHTRHDLGHYRANIPPENYMSIKAPHQTQTYRTEMQRVRSEDETKQIIWSQVTQSIQGCQSLEQLNAMINQIQESPEYRTLMTPSHVGAGPNYDHLFQELNDNKAYELGWQPHQYR